MAFLAHFADIFHLLYPHFPSFFISGFFSYFLLNCRHHFLSYFVLHAIQHLPINIWQMPEGVGTLSYGIPLFSQGFPLVSCSCDFLCDSSFLFKDLNKIENMNFKAPFFLLFLLPPPHVLLLLLISSDIFLTEYWGRKLSHKRECWRQLTHFITFLKFEWN